jgi:ParB-like chromosome segregation protein Spo0J
MNLRSTLSLLLAVWLPKVLWAQEEAAAGGLRDSGKIYVVVGVILLLLAGMLSYLVSLDRKIQRLERRISRRDEL